MNPLVAVAGGIAAALVLRTVLGLGGKGGRTVQHQKVKFWAPEEVPRLRALLQNSHTEAHPSVERVWLIKPGPSPSNALQHVTAIRMRGNVAATSPNLFSQGEVRMMGEITPEELGSGTLTPGFVVVPGL